MKAGFTLLEKEERSEVTHFHSGHEMSSAIRDTARRLSSEANAGLFHTPSTVRNKCLLFTNYPVSGILHFAMMKSETSSFILLFQDCLGYLRLHVYFRVDVSISAKKKRVVGILIWMALISRSFWVVLISNNTRYPNS